MKCLKYLWYIIRHKWFVFLECRKIGLWQLGIIHDWSKFRPSEFFPYAEHFYGKGIEMNCYKCVHKIWGSQCGFNGSGIGDGEQALSCKDYATTGAGIRDKTGYYKPTDTGDPAFDFAWLLHQKRNKHHWQWWILPEDEGGVKILQIQEKYHNEMVCDWHGASRAQGHGGDIFEWWQTNNHKLQLHSFTRELLVAYICTQHPH